MLMPSSVLRKDIKDFVGLYFLPRRSLFILKDLLSWVSAVGVRNGNSTPSENLLLSFFSPKYYPFLFF